MKAKYICDGPQGKPDRVAGDDGGGHIVGGAPGGASPVGEGGEGLADVAEARGGGPGLPQDPRRAPPLRGGMGRKGVGRWSGSPTGKRRKFPSTLRPREG